MAERTSNEMGNLSLNLSLQTKKNKFSRDLLQRFNVSSSNSLDLIRSDPNEEVELNLGLSLGGRFGIDKSNSNKLIRSSSIATILPVVKDDDVLGSGYNKTGQTGLYSGLSRTTSLPVETEEEWRKRKELQSLRRMAAKRRRSEKQRSLTRGEREEYVAAMGRVGSNVGSGSWDFGSVTTAATEDGGGGTVPGSVESQASNVAEFESRLVKGSSTEDLISPTSAPPTQERLNQDNNINNNNIGPSRSKSKPVDPTIPPSRPKPEASTNNNNNNKGKEIKSNTFDMPCVFTQGDSPSGRRIEGILYKYGKGEEVKIMCVCHGSFLSPAEFVKHAGGTDVVHPLKHIVVNPNSSNYL